MAGNTFSGSPFWVADPTTGQPGGIKITYGGVDSAAQADNADDFTGCTVRIWRAQTIPQNLATVLLGGVFNLFAASVAGTRFSLIAVARSDV